MDYLSDDEIFELLNSFSEHNMDLTSFVQLVEALGWGDFVAEPIMRTASSYATICCETDYSFSSEDYSWLEIATQICEVHIDYERYIVAVDLDCNFDNYYLPCAALVKILSCVREGECLFVFKLNNGIAFGSRRSFGSSKTSDFCISRFIPVALEDHEIDETLEEFISSLEDAEWDEIPQLIIDSSPQEKVQKSANYDRERFDPEYISFLQNFSLMYGVDTSRQADEYTQSFVACHEAIDITYGDASIMLERIGIDRGSSYDILNDADEAETLSNQLKLGEEAKDRAILPDTAERIIGQYSKEAFDNAELLLKEIMKQDT